MRVFVAIDVPEDIKEELWKDFREWRRALGGVKWVEAHNLHLTLRFIGETTSDRVDKLIQGLKDKLWAHSPFTIILEGVGTFPNWKRPRVLWVGVRGDLDPLFKLQKAIEEVVSDVGFPPDDKGFHPHLTIGRVKRGKKVSSHPKEPNFSYPFIVGRVVVMESTLTQDGPVYTPLSEIRLRGGAG